MPRYIAFLRAINVGGHNVTMERLRGLFEELGYDNVETFIASGNVIFETSARSAAKLQKAIEAHLHAALGYEVATMLRTDAEVAAIVKYRPFSEEAIAGATSFNVGFVADPFDAKAAAAVLAFRNDVDDFHVHGREVYWISSLRQSDSKFSNAVFERALKVRATFRGMKTVVKLAAKYPG